MGGHSGAQALPTRCPVCKGAVIQRMSGRPPGLIWFQCFFCTHTWKVRVDNAHAFPDGELVGDVFVIAADGQRHPLGSVVLTAIPEHTLTEHLERRTAQRERENGKLQSEIDALGATLEKAQAEEDRLWNIQKSDESDVQKANAWSLVYNNTKKLTRQLEILRAQQNDLKSEEYFFQDIPDPISSAQTDADGKFTLLMPRDGRYGVVARASRELNGKQETYGWFVWVSLGGDASKRLVLNNENIVGAGSADSALR